MDKEKAVERLMAKTKLSYEENKNVLEETNWDILDAVLVLEKREKINKPDISVFYTNKINEEETFKEVVKVKYNEEDKKSFLEIICALIDTLNNIFFRIVRNNKVVVKLPLTVVILLLFFTFWISVPLFIIGFFYDVEYSFIGRGAEDKKINTILKSISKEVQYRKNNRRGKKI